jgi:hypothetical protein
MFSQRFVIRVLVAALITLPLASAQGAEKTRRVRNDVREGPGSYYPLVCVLPANTPVEILLKQGGWRQVRLESTARLPEDVKPGTSGGLWLSGNCFSEKTAPGALKEIQFPWKSLSASPAAVTAAVRGFALRYGPAPADRLQALDGLGQPFFTPEEYLRFKAETDALRKDRAKPPSIPEDKASGGTYEVTLAEAGVGQAVSALLADRGVVEDRALLGYVNLVAAYLAEHTEAYDVPFTVYVIPGDDLYAMSVPGGTIFLTEGMIRSCGDEADLAAVIAHEMMHVTLRHGVKEIGKRPTKIKADLAMRELDARAGEPADPVMEDLESFALDAYESVSKPRLQRYEVEADQGASLLLARAGYDPAALPRMVVKVRDRVAAGGPGSRNNPFLKMDFQDRYVQASAFVNSSLADVRGMTNRGRFQAYTASPTCQEPLPAGQPSNE